MAMTLIVLAATMGNKYGGLKQLEGIGQWRNDIRLFRI